MNNEHLQTLAVDFYERVDTILLILEQACLLKSEKIPRDALLSSVSFSRRSDALATLELLAEKSIFELQGSLVIRCISLQFLKQLNMLLKGMTLVPKETLDSEVKIALTPPRPPNRLEMEVKKQGLGTGLIYKTEEVFDHMAIQAKTGFTVMTPFLDEMGSAILLELFSKVSEAVEKKLILRFISKGVSYSRFPSGYPGIKGDLEKLDVAVYDYAIARAHEPMLETFHAKVILSDENQVYLGSTNFNQYSLDNSMELGTLITGEPVRQVASIINAIIKVSKRIY